MKRKKNVVHYDYHLGQVDLQRVNEEKDLGVMITSKLMWETQVLMVSARAEAIRFSPSHLSYADRCQG